MSTAREEILGRVRAATVRAGSDPGLTPPYDRRVERAYRRTLGLDRAATVERFCERVADYRATVRRCRESEVAATVAAVPARPLLVPDGVPAAWVPAGAAVTRDRGLAPAELDEVGGVLTGCTLAIAETGTIVLSGAPAEGRRALTLVPDLHVCVVRPDQVVDSVPAAFEALGPLVRDERRPLTLVSGPSATSDIELDRVEGVHGPRTLIVIVVDEEEP
ncbi:MAG TPA: LUD domain-containing protein [Gaiellaceae bacterium]|nr:LUD domain-containing protein [Gaiellaceae bacterium]